MGVYYNLRKLRERRERLGLSQYRLARRLGVGQGTLSRWETGRRVPHDTFLLLWQRVLEDLERCGSAA